MSVPDLKEKQHFKAKIRYAHQGAPALIEQIDDDLIRCTFEKPQRAMTPGQALVFYDGEYVAGRWVRPSKDDHTRRNFRLYSFGIAKPLFCTAAIR